MLKNLKNEKWVVAVSGGPDSMALLDMCKQANLNIVVAHVNYHKRKTANRDEACVRAYCVCHNIPLEVIAPKQKQKDNFQAWAREVRYEFFFDCIDKYEASGVLVAHHQDDVIETYLMQKKRKSIPDTYGIAKETKMGNYRVIRPLLKMTKEACINYCGVNNVDYQFDESNLTDAYTRNKIRHDIVEKLSKKERTIIIKEISQLNKEIALNNKKVSSYIKAERLECDVISEWNEPQRITFIRKWLKAHGQREANNSKAYIKEIDKMICSNKNYEISLENGYFVKSYKFCEIVGNSDKSYSFVLQSIGAFKTSVFEVSLKGSSINAATVNEDDFPLTIRNALPNDKIKLRLGTKKINRWFIDRKIPNQERKIWPVVENCKKEIILVPGIGCNVEHYTIKPNLFVIKY